MNSAIGFFDGFDGVLVGIVYGSLIGFSIVFQLIRYYCIKKNAKKAENEVADEDKSGDETKEKKNLLAGMKKDAANKAYVDTAPIETQEQLLTNGDKQDWKPERLKILNDLWRWTY